MRVDDPLSPRISGRVLEQPRMVWTPVDFLDLGTRAAVDKALQRLAEAGELRRLARGLYDRPRLNSLTKRPSAPDYRAVIDAVARRDRVRVLLDGMTAANDLGLTTAVPARIEVLVDARLQPIHLGRQEIHFRLAGPRRLYWAGRPAMRVVQALHWLRDVLEDDEERRAVLVKLCATLSRPPHGPAIREDLREGLPTLPTWMQGTVRDLLRQTETQLGAER